MRTIIMLERVDWPAVAVVCLFNAILFAFVAPEPWLGMTFWACCGVVAGGAEMTFWYDDGPLGPGLNGIVLYLLGLWVMGGFLGSIGFALGNLPLALIVDDASFGTMGFLGGLGALAIVPIRATQIPPEWYPGQ